MPPKAVPAMHAQSPRRADEAHPVVPLAAPLAAEAVRLLVAGVWVPVPSRAAPLRLREFLEGTLGLDPAYVRERVQTILCDGLAVDDLDAPLPANARMGLSAALPGVLGATLRRGGAYAPMRRDITLMPASAGAPVSAASAPTAPFWVQVRYFNVIAAEQSLGLLRRGVAARAGDLGPQLCLLSRQLAMPLPPDLPPLPCADLLWLRIHPNGEHS